MLSIPHLIIIFVVALVVFGPEKLPDLARNLGKIMGEFRRATGDLRSTFEGHLRDLERESEQRKIAAATAVPAPAPPALTGEVPSEPGTVPAMPPHVAAAGAAEDEFPAQAPPAASESSEARAEAPAGAGSSEPVNTEIHLSENPATKQPENGHSETNQQTETVSDGGNRPA